MLQGIGIGTGIDMEKLIEAGLMVEELVKHRGCDSYIQRIEKLKRAGEGVGKRGKQEGKMGNFSRCSTMWTGIWMRCWGSWGKPAVCAVWPETRRGL